MLYHLKSLVLPYSSDLLKVSIKSPREGSEKVFLKSLLYNYPCLILNLWLCFLSLLYVLEPLYPSYLMLTETYFLWCFHMHKYVHVVTNGINSMQYGSFIEALGSNLRENIVLVLEWTSSISSPELFQIEFTTHNYSLRVKLKYIKSIFFIKKN